MKACVVQPYYSLDISDMQKCFDGLCNLIAKCDDSMDIIVLPEYCDIPVSVPNKEEWIGAAVAHHDKIANLASETAKRCSALVFANYVEKCETGYRNTTHVFDRDGLEVGKYYKAHPAPGEAAVDTSYCETFGKPYILELEGIRFAFLTCYDFYMYESFAAIAREKVDIIIGCCHQRTDEHSALEIIGRFLCYQTNAYLVRAAISMGEDSGVCGCSMIVSPKGEMLVNMKNDVGLATFDIDIHQKYYKSAGFGGAKKAHYEYIEDGRRPWLYRPAGNTVIRNDSDLPYPRVCAHRGFSAIAPENSLPAYGAAVALGAEEIEFDLWRTKDGHLVSMHDSELERLSDGTGKVWEYTLEELKKLDFGAGNAKSFAGLEVATFEEILQKFGSTTILNIHMKLWDLPDGQDRAYQKITDTLRRFDCEKHAYIMSSNDKCLEEFHKIAPEIHRCTGWDEEKEDFRKIVDRAIRTGCEKVQLYKPYFDKDTIAYAHQNGIRCNVFRADNAGEAKKFLDWGADTILTNDCLLIKRVVKTKQER